MRIVITGEIGKGTGQYSHGHFVDAISKRAADDNHLEIVGNGPGGDMSEADKIYSEMQLLRKSGVKIDMVVTSEMHSAYSYIMQGADHRAIFHHGKGLVHNCLVSPNKPMNVHELEALKASAAAWDSGMTEIYSKRTGKPVSFWLDIMKQNKEWSANELLEMGLIDEVVQPAKAAALSQAIENNNQPINNNLMTAIEEQLKSFQETISALPKNIADSLRATFSALAPKAMIEDALEDGTVIWVESEDGDWQGKSVFVDSADGKIPAPDGEHKLRDGRTIVTAGGVITEIKESAPDEMEALKSEIEALKAERDAANATAAQAIEGANQAIQAMAKNIKSEAVAPIRTTVAPKAVAQNGSAPENTFSIPAMYAKKMGITIEQATEILERQSKKQ